MAPSFLQEKLNTNYVPTAVETTFIEHELAKSKAQLSLLNAEIGRLQERFNQLSVEKEGLNIVSAKARGLLAPARRLIPEILQEIFYHCLPVTHNAVMSALEAPLLLGRVCSYWRQIAYSTPKLWASLHIVAPIPGPYDPLPIDNTSLLAAVSQWLARSGVLPLSISMTPQCCVIPMNDHLRPFLDILSHFTCRWRSISFRFEYYDWVEFFNRYGAEDVPLLEAADFDGYQISDAQRGDFEAAIRENGILYAPRLCSVSIPRFASNILRLPVRWSELVELNFSNSCFLLQDILAALGRCPKLRNCCISVPNMARGSYAEEDLPPSKIIMPKLEVLELRNCSCQEDMRILFETLITPQLCHLSYHQPFTPVRAEHERRLMGALNTFLHNLIEPLQELELDVSGLVFESLIEILEMVPDLKRLSITGYGVAENVAPHSHLWTIASHSPFTDLALRRFIPRVLTVQHQSTSSVSQRSLGVVDDDHPDIDSNSSPLEEPAERLLSGPLMSPLSRSRAVIGRLCPKLQVFDCKGAMFLESTFLEFLRARSLRHEELDVVHLKTVNIVYVPGVKSDENFTKQVIELGKLTGINVFLTYVDPAILPVVNDMYGLQYAEGLFTPPVHLGVW